MNSGSHCTYHPLIVPGPVLFTAPDAQENNDCILSITGTIPSTRNRKLFQARVGGLETDGQCGEGVTLEAAGRGLGYSSTLLLAGYLPGGGCHIPFQKAGNCFPCQQWGEVSQFHYSWCVSCTFLPFP